ncbi:MAG: bifunctional hydroxymethylpyrimidine kinase/phosphomethylpyrimidine kinase [Prevotellaceae bacterium]|nr:bifunctional hydroxymethylpyrimidine kinase/phosphomethylpyrimidine kinase [Prevotellaceae bacterium]
MKVPIILSIAGSDSGGGAGIQADIKTASAIGVYAATAITAITVQNTMGVRNVLPVPYSIVNEQIEAVMDDMAVDAIKTGMLGEPEIVVAIADAIDKYAPPFVVVDPVMVSTSGHRLIAERTAELMKELLFPRATLITPNIDEATVLTGIPISTVEDMLDAGKALLKMGCKAVLMKGGHLAGEEMTDILLQENQEPKFYWSERIDTPNTHDTGCTLSSAIASYLALGNDLEKAVGLAKIYISKAIRAGADWQIGEGNGPVNHLFEKIK